MSRSLLALLLIVPMLHAVPKPEGRKDADVSVVGTIEKLSSGSKTLSDRSIATTFTARVKVTKGEKGKKPAAGDVVVVQWTELTVESPLPRDKRLKGAGFVYYPVKAKDRVRLWLKQEDKGWRLITAD